jgi:riboflavin biosynthesis pyrimidine reductase
MMPWVRRLMPAPAKGRLDGDDLDEIYAYPSGRAWLRANMVASVDGAATADGRSRGLSSAADRRVFSRLRALADVILVGAGTARVERYAAVRPEQTRVESRLARGQSPTPAIAVVSSRLDVDPAAPLFRGAPTRTLVLTSRSAPGGTLAALRDVADVVVAGEELVDLGAALDELASRGLVRVLCEGGPTLLSRVAGSGRLDELCLTISPLLAGGDAMRVLHGPVVTPPLRLRLDTLLEDDGSLFARYLVA